MAAALTAKDNARAKQARQLFKEGQYEDAAKIFSSLSTEYPDKLVFTRNLGACYYYLRRPEPALSNLREYLRRSQDIAADDRAEVEGWMVEMERLRDQPAATAGTAAGPLPQQTPAVGSWPATPGTNGPAPAYSEPPVGGAGPSAQGSGYQQSQPSYQPPQAYPPPQGYAPQADAPPPGYYAPQPAYGQQPTDGQPPAYAPPPAYVPPPAYAPPPTVPPYRRGFLMMPYLGLNVPVGSTSDGISTGLRLGGIFGWHVGRFLSLNGEMTIDILNFDTGPGVSATAAAVDLTFSPFFHFGLPQVEFVVGPKFGFFGKSVTLSESGSQDSTYSGGGLVYGFNAGVFIPLGRIAIGGLFNFTGRSYSSWCSNDSSTNYSQVCTTDRSGPDDKFIGFSGALLY
jgi:hypothetical protein